jgi:two-component system, OmpR family, response regulator TrcR
MTKILIIEDNRELRQQLGAGLRQTGALVYEAPNGVIGLRLFAQYRPAVIITDLVMADGEGIESIRRIRGMDSRVLIVAISGNPDYLRSSGKLGADHMLLKPFRMQDLMALIGETAP